MKNLGIKYDFSLIIIILFKLQYNISRSLEIYRIMASIGNTHFPYHILESHK
jgi:hypothetical protein